MSCRMYAVIKINLKLVCIVEVKIINFFINIKKKIFCLLNYNEKKLFNLHCLLTTDEFVGLCFKYFNHIYKKNYITYILIILPNYFLLLF